MPSTTNLETSSLSVAVPVRAHARKEIGKQTQPPNLPSHRKRATIGILTARLGWNGTSFRSSLSPGVRPWPSSGMQVEKRSGVER